MNIVGYILFKKNILLSSVIFVPIICYYFKLNLMGYQFIHVLLNLIYVRAACDVAYFKMYTEINTDLYLSSVAISIIFTAVFSALYFLYILFFWDNYIKYTSFRIQVIKNNTRFYVLLNLSIVLCFYFFLFWATNSDGNPNNCSLFSNIYRGSFSIKPNIFALLYFGILEILVICNVILSLTAIKLQLVKRRKS